MGCDLHGDSQPIQVGRRMTFAGGIFDQTHIAWAKSMRGPIREPDRRPSHQPYLPAPKRSWMKIHEVPWSSFLHAKTHRASDFDFRQRLGLDLLDVALAIAAGIQSVDTHARSSFATRSVVGHVGHTFRPFDGVIILQFPRVYLCCLFTRRSPHREILPAESSRCGSLEHEVKTAPPGSVYAHERNARAMRHQSSNHHGSCDRVP